MKIAVLLVEDAKQIMITPENDHERSALKMIAPGDKIEAVTKWGTFMDKERSNVGYEVGMSQGGVYRAYADTESLMFIITKKKEVDELPQNTSVSEAKVNTSEANQTKEGKE